MRHGIIALLMCASFAQTLPDAPSASKKVTDRNFWMLTGYNTGATIADMGTTSALVGHQPQCRYEGGTVFLYGKHANDERVIAVMTAEMVLTPTASYFLKKYNVRIGKLKLSPLMFLVSGTAHATGAARNMRHRR